MLNSSWREQQPFTRATKQGAAETPDWEEASAARWRKSKPSQQQWVPSACEPGSCQSLIHKEFLGKERCLPKHLQNSPSPFLQSTCFACCRSPGKMAATSLARSVVTQCSSHGLLASSIWGAQGASLSWDVNLLIFPPGNICGAKRSPA